MNKRIKKKVTKKVLIKIKNKKPLSKFETKFFIKHIIPTFIETFIAFKKALEKTLPTVIKIDTERANELSDAMEESEQADNVATQKLESVNKELYIYTDNELAKAKVTSSYEGMQERQLKFSDEGLQLVPEKTKESETYFKQIAKVDVDTYEGENSDWLGEVDFAKGPEMMVHSVARIQKESKCQRAKGKLKGWFGK